MEKFIFTNKYGKSISIGYNDADFQLLKYDGLTTVETLPYTYSGFQQYGNSVPHMGVGVRIITINFLDVADTILDAYGRRRNLAGVFNPLNLGTLTYMNDYITVDLEDVEVSTQPTATKRYGTLQEYEVELTAHNPFFRSHNMIIENVNGSTAIKLDGDMDAPYILTFTNTTSSAVSNIYFSHMIDYTGTTDYTGRSGTYPAGNMLIETIAANKSFSINTKYGHKGVANSDMNSFSNQGVNEWQTITNLKNVSAFTNLSCVGTNRFGYGRTDVPAKIKYYNWYANI